MPQSETGLYLAALFLRFGVPLGLTIFFAWLLKNLDLQWLREVDESAEEAEKMLDAASPGCWILHNFPKEKWLDVKFGDACWKVRIRFEGDLPDECLDCMCFREGLLEIAA